MSRELEPDSYYQWSSQADLAVRTLPILSRAALELRHFEFQSLAEIARALGLSHQETDGLLTVAERELDIAMDAVLVGARPPFETMSEPVRDRQPSRASVPKNIPSSNRRRVRVLPPPGYRILQITEFLYSHPTYENLFESAVLEMRVEYYSALSDGRPVKAAWARFRGVIGVLFSFLGHGLGTMVRRAVGLAKALGSLG